MKNYASDIAPVESFHILIPSFSHGNSRHMQKTHLQNQFKSVQSLGLNGKCRKSMVSARHQHYITLLSLLLLQSQTTLRMSIVSGSKLQPTT